jgi:YihY family inner membrane protein
VDATQRRTRPLAFLYAVIKKFGDDQAGNLAGLIAYYAFFSIFPLLLVMVTVLGFVLGSSNSVGMDALKRFPIVGQQLQNGSLRGSGAALIIGIALALWAGLGVVQAMQNAMNTVWNVPLVRRPNFLGRLWRSGVALVLLGAATVATTVLSGLGGGGALGSVAAIGGILWSLIVNVALYLITFRVLTQEEVSWGDVFPGAIVAGIAWTALQALGGWYVNRQVKGASQTYGTFAVVIGLLSYLYLGAQVSLLAAEINVVRARKLWPRSLVQPPLTDADRTALASYGSQEQRRPEEQIYVHFEEEEAAGRAPEPDQPPPENRGSASSDSTS